MLSNFRSIPITVFILLLAVCSHIPVSASDELHPDFLKNTAELSPQQRDILNTDREIFLELINFARFNINFHQTCNKQWSWRSWIYPIAQEAGTGASFANTLTDLSQRARGLQNLDHISAPSQKRGLSSAVVGYAINGTSSAAELVQNTMVVYLASRRGFSPRDSVAFVKKTLSKIDALMAERQRLVSSMDAGSNLDALNLEGRLLRQIRRQLLLEFERWSASSREQMWRENTFYAINAGANFGSFDSAILGLQAFTDSKLRGEAAITGLVSNSLAALNPFIRSSVGWYARKHERRRLAKEFAYKRPRSTKEILSGWKDLDTPVSELKLNSEDAVHFKEIAFLSENSEREEDALAAEQGRLEKLRRVAAQQAISGPIIGTFGVARSLLSTIAYYGYPTEPIVRNQLAFAGRISQATGQVYSLIATPNARIKQSLYKRKLRRQGELPEQVLESRMKKLNQLEAEIKASR